MLVGKAIEYSLIAYGLLFGISLFVSMVIRLIYWFLNKSGNQKPSEGKEA